MKVTYQGVAGAYSHIAAKEIFPEAELDGYVATLIGLGHDVSYSKLLGCPHGAITPEEWETIYAFIFKHLLKKEN